MSIDVREIRSFACVLFHLFPLSMRLETRDCHNTTCHHPHRDFDHYKSMFWLLDSHAKMRTQFDKRLRATHIRQMVES